MHQVFSIKKLLPFLLAVSVILCGCRKADTEQKEGYLFGEWIALMIEETGITESDLDTVCFPGTENTIYFESLQAASEWGILLEGDVFNVSEPLSREWTARTLSNFYGEKGGSAEVSDLNDAKFQQEILWCVERGYLKCEDGVFRPCDPISKEEAERALKEVVYDADHRKFSTDTGEICWVETEDFILNKEDMESEFHTESEIRKGTILHVLQDGEDNWYTVDEFRKDGEKYYADVHETLPEELGDIELQGEAEVDFTDAVIIPADGSGQFSFHANGITLLKTEPLRKQFTIKGYTVVLRTSSSSVRADITRPLSSSWELNASVGISGVKTAYRFRTGSDDNSYFRVSFRSDEELCAETNSDAARYSDFKGMKVTDIPAALLQKWKENGLTEETVIELCKVEIPLPHQPALKLGISMELCINAAGNAEIHLSQSSILGAETRNGKVRWIKECERSRTAEISADAGISAGIRFALNVVKKTAADLSVRTGVKASTKTQLHLLDPDGNMQSTESSVPVNEAEQAARNNPYLLVCSDTEANWILSLVVNGSESMLGRLGLGKSLTILDASNAPLFSFLTQHFENGLPVESCTRKAGKRLPDAQSLRIAETLTIRDYSLVLKTGETKAIQISAVPSGYNKEDLIFESTDINTITADKKGNVTAVSPGTAEVLVRTRDNQYKVQCSVIVSRGF